MRSLILSFALAMLPMISIAAESHLTNQDRESIAQYFLSSHGQGQPQLFTFSDGMWGLSDGQKLTRVMTGSEFQAWKSSLDTSSYAFEVAQKMEASRAIVFEELYRNQPQDEASPKINVAVYVRELATEYSGEAW